MIKRIKSVATLAVLLAFSALVIIYNSTHYSSRAGVYRAGGRYQWIPDYGIVDTVVSASEWVAFGMVAVALVGMAIEKVRS